MKPNTFSPAHTNVNLAELVCSNSFRSNDLTSGVGLLKEEMRRTKSLIMDVAARTQVPAGKALAVDRTLFAEQVTKCLEQCRSLEIKRKEISSLNDPALTLFSCLVIAAGPLASDSLTHSLQSVIGEQSLYFYDAIAPIVTADSINWDKVFLGSRYDPQGKDYVNCPLTEEQYHLFRQSLLRGEYVALQSFESEVHFEGCLPIETMAERGEMTLAFGPLKPVGLVDPRTGKEPFAVVQLRAEDVSMRSFNMVGFQTKLTYLEQTRIFRQIPGLEEAEFERLGSIHRNTFVNSPFVLRQDLEMHRRPGVFLAGQITGVEGYVESAAVGLWLGKYLAGREHNTSISLPPQETTLGGLLRFLNTPKKHFQPMNVNFGLLPPLEQRAKKAKRKELYAQRALQACDVWLKTLGPE
jgi:methylenetetrahydrofolate--tRNA-(uracil-5-)-methyltransferase